MSSLRSKILSVYGLSKLVMLAFAAVVFADLHFVQNRIGAGEAVNGLHDAAQEMRRDEKNLFLYGDLANLDQAMAQADAAEQVLKSARPTFLAIATPAELQTLHALLDRYRAQLAQYPFLHGPAGERQREVIRQSGQRLLAMTEDFRRRERQVIGESVRTAGFTLLAAFLAVVAIGVGGAFFLIRQVAQPLRRLENALQTVGEGRTRELPVVAKDREIRSVVQAFNAMLARLRAQQERLKHNEKAAALGVLASGVAHELNNPLSNISTSVQLLLEDDASAGPEQRQQWLRHIDDESERARRIVRRLLDSVRHPRLQLCTHELGDLVHAALNGVHHQLPAQVRVCVDASPALQVAVDRERLHQVFINLFRNAADAGASRLTLRARASTWAACNPGDNGHLVGDTGPLAEAAALTHIEIEDNGPGVPENHLASIFDPFFTTRATGEGTGLGLYLVEEIVTEHGGCIAVENRSEGGARFSVWLPANPGATPA